MWRQQALRRVRLFEELIEDDEGYFSNAASKFLNRQVKAAVDTDPDDIGKLSYLTSPS